MNRNIIILLLVLVLCGCNNTIDKSEQRDFSGCNMGCQTKSYTVSKPVEVIYKDVTYTTVYEPKTYNTTKYSRKPYNRCDICNEN